MEVITPPSVKMSYYHSPSFFLAGSIDMGKAEKWQDRLIADLENESGILYNPRNEDFDPSLRQAMDEPKFVSQVGWELHYLEKCDYVFVYFDANGKAPITMLELGAFKDKVAVVCCPKEFWRSGNIEIFCVRYGIPLVRSYEQFLLLVKSVISKSSP